MTHASLALTWCMLLCCAIAWTAEIQNIRSASTALIYKRSRYSGTVSLDVRGDFLIIVNATVAESNAFVLKKSNETYNYEVVYIHQSEATAVSTNGRWFAVSSSNSTTLFQLDKNFNKINEHVIPQAAEFINLQQDDLFVMVNSGSVVSYRVGSQGEWQVVDSLAVQDVFIARVHFLENKMAVSFADGNTQHYRFYQCINSTWSQIDEFSENNGLITKVLAWNGADVLLKYNQIMVKSDGVWTSKAFFSSAVDYSVDAAFLDEGSFITSEFKQSNNASIFRRGDDTNWFVETFFVDALQRPNVDSFAQFVTDGSALVIASLDAANYPAKVLIDEIAVKCDTNNTIIDCEIELDDCQDVTITHYWTINRPCALVVEPKPFPLHLENAFGTITTGPFKITSEGFEYTCQGVIRCPAASQLPPSVRSPISTAPTVITPVNSDPSAVTSSTTIVSYSVMASLVLFTLTIIV